MTSGAPSRTNEHVPGDQDDDGGSDLLLDSPRMVNRASESTRNVRMTRLAGAIFFTGFGCLGCAFPYLPLVLEANGVTLDQIGYVMLARSFGGALISPVMGAVADAGHGHHKQVMMLCLVLYAAAFIAVPFIQHIKALLILSILCGSFFSSPFLALADTGAMMSLGEDHGLYGRLRLWGAIGWGSFAFLSGVIGTHYGLDASFYTFAAMSVVSVTVALLFHFPEHRPKSKSNESEEMESILHVAEDEEDEDEHVGEAIELQTMNANPTHQQSTPKNTSSDQTERIAASSPSVASSASHYGPLWSTLKRREVIVFLVMIIFIGMAVVVIEAFLFLYLATLPDASQTLFGLVLVATCVAEIPVFFFSGRIIAYLGHRGTLQLVLLCFILRHVWYALLPSFPNPSAYYTLVVEPLHGVTFALMYAEATAFAFHAAPPGHQATLQAIVSCCYNGIGWGFGSLYAGFVFQNYGGQKLFISTSLGLTALLMVYYAVCEVFLRDSERLDNATRFGAGATPVRREWLRSGCALRLCCSSRRRNNSSGGEHSGTRSVLVPSEDTD